MSTDRVYAPPSHRQSPPMNDDVWTPNKHEHGVAHEHEHDVEHDDGKPRIAFIGAGRVGTALGAAFARAGWQVTAVASRDEERRRRFQEKVAGARAYLDAHAVL